MVGFSDGLGGPALRMNYRSDELLRPRVLDFNQPLPDPVQLPQLLAQHRLQYGSGHPMQRHVPECFRP